MIQTTPTTRTTRTTRTEQLLILLMINIKMFITPIQFNSKQLLKQHVQLQQVQPHQHDINQINNKLKL